MWHVNMAERSLYPQVVSLLLFACKLLSNWSSAVMVGGLHISGGQPSPLPACQPLFSANQSAVHFFYRRGPWRPMPTQVMLTAQIFTQVWDGGQSRGVAE